MADVHVLYYKRKWILLEDGPRLVGAVSSDKVQLVVSQWHICNNSSLSWVESPVGQSTVLVNSFKVTMRHMLNACESHKHLLFNDDLQINSTNITKEAYYGYWYSEHIHKA